MKKRDKSLLKTHSGQMELKFEEAREKDIAVIQEIRWVFWCEFQLRGLDSTGYFSTNYAGRICWFQSKDRGNREGQILAWVRDTGVVHGNRSGRQEGKLQVEGGRAVAMAICSAMLNESPWLGIHREKRLIEVTAWTSGERTTFMFQS